MPGGHGGGPAAERDPGTCWRLPHSVDADLATLSPADRDWIARDERRWARAAAIAAAHPGMDPGGVYRVLRNLEKSPTERLREGLTHGRLFRVHEG